MSYPIPRPFAPLLLLALLGALAGCESLPAGGISGGDVDALTTDQGVANTTIQVVDLDQAVVRQLERQQAHTSFEAAFGQVAQRALLIGPGDFVEITIWEAPPATLFGIAGDVRLGIAPSQATVLPEQVVDSSGYVTVPFAGRLKAGGVTPAVLQIGIAKALRGKANQPEVLVRVTRPAANAVTVVGDVNNSLRMPLTDSGERLLDALAAAGGVRQPVNKMMVQLTRGGSATSMPLDKVIRDPRQNVRLQAGDIVLAMFQPFSFTALGATGRNEEVPFEAQGISLAQAIARVGGLVDERSDPEGVFVFRFEDADTMPWPHPPVVQTEDHRVAVIYRVNMRDPGSYFLMQKFAIRHDDLLYVSNAPVADLQKFLNVVLSIAYPILNISQQISN